MNQKYLLVGGGVAVVAALMLGVKQIVPVSKPLTLARADVQLVIKKHPNWDAFSKLNRDMEALQRKWGITNAATDGNQSSNENETSPEIQSQLGEITRIYNEEGKVKLDSLNKNITNFVQTKTQQLTSLLTDKLKNINDQLAKEVQAKTKESELKLQSYYTNLQNEYQITLSNLQLQLSLNDPAADLKNKNEKERIQTEINRIQNEMEQKKAAKKTAIQTELESFIANKQKAARDQFEKFKTEKEQQLRVEIIAYRQKQESTFESWSKQKAGELDSAKKVRQQEWQSNYQQDSIRQSIIKSQKEQLEEAMVWDVQQTAKKVAHQKQIDCVLAGGIVNVNLPDLTDEIGKIIYKSE